MSDDTERNALTQKLGDLENRYMAFSHETNKPLLVWQVDPGDEDIVRVFVAYAQAGGMVDDLLVDMTVPFEDRAGYAEALTADLHRQYEADKAGMAEEGLDTGWVCPAYRVEENDIQNMFRVLTDFHNYHAAVYKGTIHHLTLFLRPKTVSDQTAFVGWVEQLLQHVPPAGLRFALLDPIAAPRFAQLIKDAEPQVHNEPLQLDYPAMLEDLAQGEGKQDGPDAKFRVLFVKMSNQAEKQDVEGVEKTAVEALRIAESQNWYQMRVVVHMVRGANFLQVRQPDDALYAYQAALEIAREAKKAADPVGAKMEIQCLFAVGSVLVSKAAYADACAPYQEAAVLAEAADDIFFTMEGRRMAGFCREMDKQYDSSIENLGWALDAGEKLPEAERGRSTLPYVGDSLLRVIKAAKKARGIFGSKKDLPDEAEVDERMTALLGDKWQSTVVRDAEGGTEPS